MNDALLLVRLQEKAGGWAEFTEELDLTVWDAEHKQVLQTAQEVYQEILNECAGPSQGNGNPKAGGVQRPTPARAMGRRAIIRNGLRDGLTLDEVQQELVDAGLPALYPRVGNEAALQYLLLLNGKLRNLLPARQRRPLYTSWLETLQKRAAEDAGRQPGGVNADAPMPPQAAALANMRRAIQQARCTYQDLVNYVNTGFENCGGTYQTIAVTGNVVNRLKQCVKAANDELHAGMTALDIWNCLDTHWDEFLNRAGADLVKNQVNAQNYLVRALVRGLEAIYSWLAEITADLRPNLPWTDARIQLCDQLTSEDSCQGDDLFYLSSVLAALFAQDRSLKAEDALPDALMDADSRQDLPVPLKPFFYFYETGVKVPANRAERVAAAKANWAAQPLYLSGVARLLLGLLDYGDEDGFDSEDHQGKMAQIYAESGGYLARVLCGEADLDRNVLLLLLLLAEDICARRMPRREQIAARLRMSSRDSEYSDLLANCGFPMLNPNVPFDAALWAALDADLPATQRKNLFVKALLVCEQAGADRTAIPPALGKEAEDCTGKSLALAQVFKQLGKGRHAGGYAGRN